MKLLVEGALIKLHNKRTHSPLTNPLGKQVAIPVGSVYIYYLFLFINAVKYMFTKLKTENGNFSTQNISCVCFFLILRKKKLGLFFFFSIILLVTEFGLFLSNSYTRRVLYCQLSCDKDTKCTSN